MKSVMISIKPKWCEMIARGQKTIEVRKSSPKLEAPFRCYIYCTKPRCEHEDFIRIDCRKIQFYGGQKVIGEFVCDYILGITPDTYGHDALNASCLTTNDLWEYGSGKTLYGWHISDLVIYDNPRGLSDFSSGSSRLTFAATKDGFPWKWSGMMRPPQSWCYVEAV